MNNIINTELRSFGLIFNLPSGIQSYPYIIQINIAKKCKKLFNLIKEGIYSAYITISSMRIANIFYSFLKNDLVDVDEIFYHDKIELLHLLIETEYRLVSDYFNDAFNICEFSSNEIAEIMDKSCTQLNNIIIGQLDVDYLTDIILKCKNIASVKFISLRLAELATSYKNSYDMMVNKFSDIDFDRIEKFDPNSVAR